MNEANVERVFTVSSMTGHSANGKWTNHTSVQDVINLFIIFFGDGHYLLFVDDTPDPLPPNGLIKDFVKGSFTNFRVIEVTSTASLIGEYRNTSPISLLEYMTIFIETKNSLMFSFIFAVDIIENDRQNEMILLWNRHPNKDGYHWTVIRRYNIQHTPIFQYMTDEDISSLNLDGDVRCHDSYPYQIDAKYDGKNVVNYIEPITQEIEKKYVWFRPPKCERCKPGKWDDSYCIGCSIRNRNYLLSISTFPNRIGFLRSWH